MKLMTRLFSYCMIACMTLAMAACSTDSDLQDTTPPTTPPTTLADSVKGTYECEMDVLKAGEVKGNKLALLCFVTPIEGSTDSVQIEVRRWSGSFMPHRLGFSGRVKLVKSADNQDTYTMENTSQTGIPYNIDIMGNGVDKKGTVQGSFQLRKEGPVFKCHFYVFSYDMTIRGLSRKTSVVLPNAISTL